MKKLLLSYFLFSSLINFAQDWQPFPLGQKSFFESNEFQFYNGFDTSILVLHADTIFDRGNFQTIFFSSTDENYGNCYGSVYFNPYQGPYSQTNNILNRTRPDSINIINDSIVFFYKTNDPEVHDPILFLPKSAVGETWYSAINIYGAIFNQLQFTCDSVYYDTVVGNVIDSLKIFSVKAFDNATPVASVFDNQKIILSKNFGYKQMVVFSGNLQSPLILNGLDNNSTQGGFNYPDFTEYFHLNVGDIVIWREDFQGDIMNPNYTKYYKDSILVSFLSSDSVYYNIKREQTNGSTSIYNQKYLRKDFEWLNKPISIFVNTSIYPFSAGVNLWETYPLFRSTNNTINREVETFGFSLDTNNCGIGQTTDMNISRRYNTKVGFSHSIDAGWFITNWSIIGSTINGIQEGVLWSTLLTGINTFENTGNIKIYPNPSSSGNFILESEQVNFIELFTIDGKTVFSKTINHPKTEIKTGLPKGLYFVKITFENKKQTTQKLIITD